MTEYEDADGDLCVDLTFVFNCTAYQWDGKEITHFLDLCGELFGDSVRVYGGGSEVRTPKVQWKKKEKSNELNQP